MPEFSLHSMAPEKKRIADNMPETDQEGWMFLRKDNEENASICLAELAPESAIVFAEEKVAWAQYDKDNKAADQWMQKRNEFLKIAESLQELPLEPDQMRWNFRDALARTLIHNMMNRLEKQMNRSKRQLLPCALIEHAQEKLGHRNMLGVIDAERHKLQMTYPAIPKEASPILYHVLKRIRSILEEWHTYIYGELEAGPDA